MPSRTLVTRMNLLAFAVLLAVTISAFMHIPAGTDLPVHWGFNGAPDRFWPRDLALLVAPAAGAVVLAITFILGRSVPPEQLDAGRHVVDWTLTGLIAIFAAIQFGLLFIGIGSDIDIIRIVAGGLAILFFVLGNELRRVEPQPFAGLRLPWTLRDPRNWRLSHAVTGSLMMLGGLALALLTWLYPDPPTLIVSILATALVPLLVGGIFSYLLSRRAA